MENGQSDGEYPNSGSPEMKTKPDDRPAPGDRRVADLQRYVLTLFIQREKRDGELVMTGELVTATVTT